MATDFPSYTRDEITQRARSIIRLEQFNERGVRDADVSIGSDYDIKARILGAVAELLQESAKSALRVIDPRQSFGDFCRQYGTIFGIGSKLTETSQAAVKATGYAIARSTTGSQAINAGTQLVHADGTVFTVDTTGSTTATAVKTFSVGHRPTRNLIFVGATVPASVAAGEVYEFATGELVAVRDAWTSVAVDNFHRWVQLESDLDADPVLGQVFTQRFGRVVPITASVAGRAGNKEPKDALTFTTPPGTVQATARIVRLTGGRDALTPAQIQNGIRGLYGTRMEQLTLEQILEFVLSTPGVTPRGAYVVPGGGAANDFSGYKIAVTGPSRCVSGAADRAAIAAHVTANAPPVEKWTVAGATQFQLALQITIKVSRSFSPDWEPTTSSTIFADGASTTTRVQFTSALSTYAPFAVGQRVILSLARGGSPIEDNCVVQRRITAIGANYFDVAALPFAPTEVCVSPGGPFADALIAALDEYIDQQAPYSTKYRYPAPTHESSIDAIAAVVAGVEGVADAVVSELFGSPVSLSEGQVLMPYIVSVRAWS